MSDKVSLLVNAQRLSGWESVSISRSIDSMAGSFDLQMVDAWFGKDTPIEPGISCSVLYNGLPIITGFADNVAVRSSKEDNLMSISGRCRTGDLVDCSVVNDNSTWKDIDIVRFAKTIVEPFDIKIINELTEPGARFRSITLSDGESPFELLDRLAKERAILIIGDENGNLVLTTAGKRRAVDNLQYGVNVMEADVSYDFTNRFSWYIVKGQGNSAGDGWGDQQVKVYGEVFDTGVPRYRPKIVSDDNDTTNAKAQSRAEWEALNRAGRSIRVSVKIQGWEQSDGSLWRENLLVYCDLPTLRIKGDMLINQVDYSLADDGTICTLQLVRADCYSHQAPSKNVKTKKTDSSWGGW